MLVIGLTGGIGSGKSEAARIFTALGVPVIDTDVIAHKLTEKKSPLLQNIIDEFGTEFLTDNNQLDRKLLSQAIFNDDKKKRRLEDILHPEIEKAVKHEISRLADTDTPYAVVVVPLLFETSFKEMVDKTLVIDASETEQIERTRKRDNKETAEIRNIMQHQLTRSERLKYTDDTLANSGSLEELKIAIEALHQRYLSTDIQ